VPQKERRKYPRAKVVCPVIMENNRNIMSGETHDISAGGAYIRCRSQPKQPEINMFISISLLSPRIRAMGAVVRSEALVDSVKEGGHYGIGVRFIAISYTDLEIISTKVAEHLESENINWREEEPEK
jgi:c-di-GMP-binding flagellar brake protein YcgR